MENATWDSIAVVEELTLVDRDLEQGTPARLIAADERLWGHYFLDKEGKKVENKFMVDV